jgi:hypothetical protein
MFRKHVSYVNDSVEEEIGFAVRNNNLRLVGVELETPGSTPCCNVRNAAAQGAIYAGNLTQQNICVQLHVIRIQVQN